MKVIEIISNFGVSDYLTLISITFIAYVTQYYYKYFTRVNPLPGPFPFPIVGNLPQYLLSGENFKSFGEYNRKKYGDVFEIHMNGRHIYLSRAEHIEKLLTPSTKNPYLLRSAAHNNGSEEMGISKKGVAFNDDYKSWRFNRQFISQAVLAPKLTQDAIFGTSKLFNELESYWDKLYVQQENKKKLDFPRWLNNFTNDMIIMLLTGERSYTMAGYFNTLSDEKANYPSAIIEDSVKLVEAFRIFLTGLPHFSHYSQLMRSYVPHLRNKTNELIQNMEFISERLDSTIKKRKKEIENTPLDKPLARDMLTSIITANTPRDVNPTKTVGGETTRPLDVSEIRCLLLETFIAGTDTTANLTSIVLHYIETYPEVKKKMLKEIDTIFQDDNKRPITENDFRNLKYCDAIVKEVSRILPITHTLSRYGDKPDEIAGYQWPAGTSFRMIVDAIQKSENYWEEPEKFNPDRWLAKGFEPRKYSFIMFGGGLRVCPGRKLAMIEVVCFISSLYRKYEVELVDKKAPLKTKVEALITCSELLINIKPRN